MCETRKCLIIIRDSDYSSLDQMFEEMEHDNDLSIHVSTDELENIDLQVPQNVRVIINPKIWCSRLLMDLLRPN